MTAGGECVLWSHDDDTLRTGRPRALVAGVGLLIVGLLLTVAVLVGGLRTRAVATVLVLSVFAGIGLVLVHLLRSRRRTIIRMWTDPTRPGVVMMRRDDGVIRTLNPARIGKVVLVQTSGSYNDARPGELGEWRSYLLTRLALRSGLTWYTTPYQTLPRDRAAGVGPDRPTSREVDSRLVATFPNARIAQRSIVLSSRESTD
ncbi:hypothetical protein [Dactylosporangium sp. NPDC000521]|uniref:hypothetical protein n=1 Tax=Dactylosporangium sp. NPDC000521 TaxID=3363975 RepID=UPI00368CC182